MDLALRGATALGVRLGSLALLIGAFLLEVFADLLGGSATFVFAGHKCLLNEPPSLTATNHCRTVPAKCAARRSATRLDNVVCVRFSQADQDWSRIWSRCTQPCSLPAGYVRAVFALGVVETESVGSGFEVCVDSRHPGVSKLLSCEGFLNLAEIAARHRRMVIQKVDGDTAPASPLAIVLKEWGFAPALKGLAYQG